MLRGLLGGIYEDEAEEDQEMKGAATIRKDANDRHWGNHSKTLCGWPRRELLKGVVLILGEQVALSHPYASLIVLQARIANSKESLYHMRSY